MAIAGQTHDLVIGTDGFMLAGTVKDKSNYKKKLESFNVGLSPGATGAFEALRGPLDAPLGGFRRAIWSKWSGTGQGMVAGADGWEKAQTDGRVNDLVRLRPVQNGAALALCPQPVSAVADAGAIGINNSFSLAFGNIQVTTFDAKIFVSANPGTNNSGFVLKATAAAVIVGLCLWAGQVLVSVNGTLNYFNPTTGAFTAFAPVLNCSFITAYQGVLVAVFGANQLYFLIAGAWVAGPGLENSINSLEELNGSLYVGTHTALYRLDGLLKPKAPATAPNTLDYFDYKISVVWRTTYFLQSYVAEYNFANMVAWKGYLWFFAGPRLYRAAPVQGRDTMQPEPQPVFGLALGLRVCGNLLVCVTRTKVSSLSDVWVNDGSFDLAQGLGWFKLASGGSWLMPFGNVGYASGMVNVAVYAPATSCTFVRFLVDQTSPVGFKSDNFGIAMTAVSGQVTLPLVTPEDLGQLAGATNGKVLAVNIRRVGLEWSLIDAGVWWQALPVSAPTLAAMQIVIEVSLDAALSWTTLVEPTLGSLSLNSWWFNGNRIELPVASNFYEQSQMYPASPPSGPGVFLPVPDMGWMVRVTWGGLQMPLLRRVWIDYDVAEVMPQTGRAWEFEVNLLDPQIGLDGAMEVSPDDALSKAGRLRDLVVSGGSTTFTDLDGVSYRVKVVGFEQRRVAQGALPGLSPGWQGTIKLEEVWPGN